jgi:O-antigen/teichoic acid export membrane protein
MLVRGLSARAYGALAIGSAVVGLLTAVGSLGLGSAVSRFGVAVEDGDTFRTPRSAAADAVALALPAAIALATLSALAAAVMLGESDLRSAGFVVLAFIPSTVLAPYQSVVSGYLVATFRPRLASVVQAGVILCQLALIGSVLVPGLTSAYQVAVIRMGTTVIGFAVLIRWLKLGHFFRLETSGSTAGRRNLLRFGWAMTLTTMAGIAISQLDVLVLGIARGSAAAGRYAPVSRLADTALLLPNAVGSYLLPAVASSSVTSRDERIAGSHYHWASRWALVIATPAVAAMLLTPSALIHVLFGFDARGLTAPARVLAVGLLVHLLFGFNGTILDALGDARLVAVRSGYGVLLSALACATLVPVLGALGAAIATVVAILGLNATCATILGRRHGISVWDMRVGAVVIAMGVGLLAGWVLASAVRQHEYLALFAVPTLAAVPGIAVAVILEWRKVTRRAAGSVEPDELSVGM